MENTTVIANIDKFNLTGLIIEECGKGPYTYLLIILNASLPILDSDKNRYKEAIVDLFRWEEPGLSGDNENRSTVLYKTVLDFESRAKAKGYEFYVFCPLNEEGTRYKIVTDHLIKLANYAKQLEDYSIGAYFGTTITPVDIK